MRRRGLLGALVVVAFLGGPAPAHAAGIFPFEGSAWNWGLPEPHGETLTAIDVAGSEAYALGSGGSLMRSTDGARSWSWLAHMRGLAYGSVRILRPGSAVAVGCGVVRIEEGGRSLRKLDFGGCARDADFVTDQSAFALGEVGQASISVLVTTDGGASFERRGVIPSDGYGSSASIDFVDEQTGLAVVAKASPGGEPGGLIARTTDGGWSWSVVRETTAPLRSVTFAGGSTAYAVGDDRSLLRSSDGGSSWTSRPLSGSAAGDLRAVRCYAPLDCLFVLGEKEGDRYTFEDRIVRSADGGETVTHETDALGNVAALDIAGARAAVATGPRGAVLRSDDGGRSFVRTGGPTDRFYAVDRVPGGRLLALRDAPRPGVAFSSDGGRSWAISDLPAEGEVSFATSRAGYLLASRCRGTRCNRMTTRLFRTGDGGRTWSRGRSRSAPSESTKLLAVGRRSILVARGRLLLRSDDAGRRLRRVSSEAVGRMRIDGFDRSGGRLFAWSARRLVASSDGGRRWWRLRRPRGVRVRRLDAVGRRASFLLTTKGVVLRTADGGRTWRRTARTRGAVGIEFTDLRKGFVDVSVPYYEDRETVDYGSAAVLRTDDGGRTYEVQRIAAEAPLQGLAATRRGGGVAVHEGDLLWTGAGR